MTVHLPVDVLVTLTTVATGNKGRHPTPPPSGQLKLPYNDNFEISKPVDGQTVFSEANNWADQSGSFEYFTNQSETSAGGRRNTLRQV